MGKIQDIGLDEAPVFFQRAVKEELSKGEVTDLWIQAKTDNEDKTYHAFIEVGNTNITLKYAPNIDKNKIERISKEFIL